jgi:hypothetical protein
MGIQKDLIDWAKETVEIYNPMAQTTGLGYYTQSVLNRENLKPELLILGINPGEFIESITITWSKLLQGNPCFKGMDDNEILYELSEKPDKRKRRYGWDLWKKVFKLLNYSQKGEILRDLDRFVISNMVFFGTANEGQIPRGIDSNKCAQQTLKLIDILKPKVVLLLGTKSKSLFETVTKTKMIEIDPKNLSYIKLKDNYVFAIKHTARFYSNVKCEEIGRTICYALEHPDSFEDKFKLIQLKHRIGSNDTIQRIDSEGKLVHEYFCKGKNGKFERENGIISIGLKIDNEGNKYVLSILSNGNHPDLFNEMICNYCEKNRWSSNNDLSYSVDITTSEDTIVNFMTFLLKEMKAYREKDTKE